MRKRAIPLLRISTTDDAASALRRFLAKPHTKKADYTRRVVAAGKVVV